MGVDVMGASEELVEETHVIKLPWERPPLSLNQRMHWGKQSKLVKEVRQAAFLLARKLPDMGRCSVELVWHVADRRRRDVDNPVATLKPLCDGLVDAEIVPDDTPEYMVKLPVRIVNSGVKKMELIIKELGNES